MQKISCLQVASAVSLALALLEQPSHAQLEQLANRVPESANAVVIVNVKEAYASPLAREKGWNQLGHQAHDAGMIALPTEAEWFLMAAEMDYEFFQPLWEITVAYVRHVPTMEEIAAHCGGRVDRLAGMQAVERPNNSFVVALGPRVVGAMSPANRQQVIRWVRQSRARKSPELSAYLFQAVDAAKDSTNQIVMALDLRGILAPAEVSSALEAQQSLKDIEARPERVAEIVAGVVGMRLEIELRNPARAKLRVDFSEEVSVLSKIAKPLLLEVLLQQGANIEEMKRWSVRTEGLAVVMEGELSSSGLRRVLTVLSGPVGPMSASSGESVSDGDEDVAAVSQRYFQSVTNYLNDLFFGDLQPQSLYQAKVWIERYARKIQDLDDYQVDKDVLAYGADVVASLHEILNVLERAETRSDLREANLYESGRRRYGRYGAYGYFEKSYVTRDRQLVQADEALRGLRTSQQIVDELRALTADTRKTMSQRYQREF